MIISKTPLRISLVGGGTDVPAFYEKHPGAVVSFSIDKYIYVAVNEKFDDSVRVSYSKTENRAVVDDIKHDLIRETLKFAHKVKGLEITTMADIPGNGTGLGSSSSLTVGLLNCLYRDQTPNWLAETAFAIEAGACRKPVGKQDHYASALGGFNYIQFSKKRVVYEDVKSLWDADNTWSQNELCEHMLLLYTGMTRQSTDILTKQKEGFQSGDTIQFGAELSNFAKEFLHKLVYGCIEDAARIISQGWEIKKKLSPWITNDFIDDWYEKGMNNGAWGGKLLGAGGGGFLFFMATPDTHHRITKATGLKRVPFRIENNGSEIVYEA